MGRVAADDVAEQIPLLALESHHLQLADGCEVGGAGVDLTPGSKVSGVACFRPAPCFITFARVRSSPQIWRTIRQGLGGAVAIDDTAAALSAPGMYLSTNAIHSVMPGSLSR